MAYFPPRFNLWCQLYRYDVGINKYRLWGYTRCQLRGPASQWQGFEPGDRGMPFELLLPLGTDIETKVLNPHEKADIVVLPGTCKRYFSVLGSLPKGGGFANEYQLVICQQVDPEAGAPLGLEAPEFHAWRLNPLLTPPDGFTPVPIIEAIDHWCVVER